MAARAIDKYLQAMMEQLQQQMQNGEQQEMQPAEVWNSCQPALASALIALSSPAWKRSNGVPPACRVRTNEHSASTTLLWAGAAPESACPR